MEPKPSAEPEKPVAQTAEQSPAPPPAKPTDSLPAELAKLSIIKKWILAPLVVILLLVIIRERVERSRRRVR